MPAPAPIAHARADRVLFGPRPSGDLRADLVAHPLRRLTFHQARESRGLAHVHAALDHRLERPRAPTEVRREQGVKRQADLRPASLIAHQTPGGPGVEWWNGASAGRIHVVPCPHRSRTGTGAPSAVAFNTSMLAWVNSSTSPAGGSAPMRLVCQSSRGAFPAAPGWAISHGQRNNSASFSDGFIQPRVCRGRSLSTCATRFRCRWLWTDKSVPLGKY